MPMNLFIFNFNKKTPWAFFLCLCMILCSEYFIKDKLDGHLMNHEVDWMLYYLDKTKYHADYLVIGDSVGLQLAKEYYQNPKFAVLATNKAIEPTGQYFLVKRYLKRNPPPKVIIFIARPFLDNNLDQVYTENFILRTFTNVDEIFEVFKTKTDLTSFFKMIAYKILFTYKFKLKLQEKIVGFTNADIYSGVDIKNSRTLYHNRSLVRIIDKIKKRKNISFQYTDKLLELLNKRKILFYYIPAPIPENDTYAKNEYDRLFLMYNEKLSRKYRYSYFFKKYEKYKKSLFVDGVHLNKEGMIPAKKFVKQKISFIDKSCRITQ